MSRAPRRLLLAAGVALGMVAGAGVAWAVWGAAGSASGSGPLTSATLDLAVIGPSGTLAGPGGTVTLPALAMTNATPGTGDSEVFTVRNNGTTTFTPSGTGVGQGDLGPYLVPTVLWGGTDAGATCTGSTTSPPLAPGAQTTVCVAVMLSASAPTTAQNASGTVLFTLTAAQA